MAIPRIDWILKSNHPPNPPNNVQTTGHPNPHSILNPSPQNHLHDHQSRRHHYFWILQRIFQQLELILLDISTTDYY